MATVATVSFHPIDINHANVTYALTNGPTVTKMVQRQTLTPYVFSGNYSETTAGSVSARFESRPTYRHLALTASSIWKARAPGVTSRADGE